MLEVSEKIQIPLDEVALQHVRSGGPGGQNVNKVATKVVLRWDVTRSPSLPEPVRARFLERHATRINSAGELVLSCDQSRSQARNIEACLSRLRALILEVAEARVERRPTRPSAGGRRRRLEGKRRLALKKRLRRSFSSDDE